jgi:hypothetical protein
MLGRIHPGRSPQLPIARASLFWCCSDSGSVSAAWSSPLGAEQPDELRRAHHVGVDHSGAPDAVRSGREPELPGAVLDVLLVGRLDEIAVLRWLPLAIQIRSPRLPSWSRITRRQRACAGGARERMGSAGATVITIDQPCSAHTSRRPRRRRRFFGGRDPDTHPRSSPRRARVSSLSWLAAGRRCHDDRDASSSEERWLGAGAARGSGW